jgi:Tol biopolymer transport system component
MNPPYGRCWLLALLLFSISGVVSAAEGTPAGTLRQQLKSAPFKIAHETYVNNNWEIFVLNADGSEPVNLTNTPKDNELYPQVSPDGKRICFGVERGEGRDAVRGLWVMDMDGGNRRKIADYARDSCWAPDSVTIAYLPQEFEKFNIVDYFSKGLSYYNVVTGKGEMHPNSTNLHHLYNPSFSANGRWIVATVHAGMGVSHAILLIEAHGDRIINLKIPGCRPCLSPDGRQIAWGAGDHEIAVAPIDLDSPEPRVGDKRFSILDKTNKIYHVDWSPDSRFLCFSRGPNGKGDISKPGTWQAACEMVGVYATDWNLCAVSAERDTPLDVASATEAECLPLTTNGMSNKEPAWFKARR